MNGNTYLHIHMAVGNPEKGEVHAGHLNRGIISLTGEFFLHQIEGETDREYSSEVGLNLIKFCIGKSKDQKPGCSFEAAVRFFVGMPMWVRLAAQAGSVLQLGRR